MPIWLAKGLTSLFEGIWKLFGLKNRPLYTQYVIFTLSIAAKYDISKAKELLAYNPYPMELGLEQTLNWLLSSKEEIVKYRK